MSETYGLNGSMNTIQSPQYLSTGLAITASAGGSNEVTALRTPRSTQEPDCRGPGFTPVLPMDLRATPYAHTREPGEIYQSTGKCVDDKVSFAAAGDMVGRGKPPYLAKNPSDTPAMGYSTTFLARR